MGIKSQTRDCVVLDDEEFSEMAALVAATVGWEPEELSKEAGDWVLATEAGDDGGLQGYVFSTLERIGGTPALLIGLAAVARDAGRGILDALHHELYHKALMAFPDEDVLVACRVDRPEPLAFLGGLSDVRPWPGVRANGEERAWGRRLAKRFGTVSFDDRTMVARSDGQVFVVDLDGEGEHPPSEVVDRMRPDEGDHLIAWGWALAEQLEGYRHPR